MKRSPLSLAAQHLLALPSPSPSDQLSPQQLALRFQQHPSLPAPGSRFPGWYRTAALQERPPQQQPNYQPAGMEVGEALRQRNLLPLVSEEPTPA